MASCFMTSTPHAHPLGPSTGGCTTPNDWSASTLHNVWVAQLTAHPGFTATAGGTTISTVCTVANCVLGLPLLNSTASTPCAGPAVVAWPQIPTHPAFQVQPQQLALAVLQSVTVGSHSLHISTDSQQPIQAVTVGQCTAGTANCTEAQQSQCDTVSAHCA
jgi:hypothetical protein